jgi:hypothetical protein
MLPQAQEMMTGQIPFDAPFGGLLTLVLLVVLASGLVFESGVLGMVRARLAGGAKPPRRIATASHHG